MSRPVKALGALALLPALLTLAVAAGLQSTLAAELAATSAATSDIPAGYLQIYQQAARACPGLSWPVLAGVGKVESDHGRSPGPSFAGAVGPMQFLPATWATYGVDGDRDGRAEATNPADAIPAAAGYLCALGAGRNVRDALISYNCGNPGPRCQAVSAGYAAAVLAVAARYGQPPAGQASPVAAIAVATALAQVGTPYRWGGQQPGGFDCSGLVRYAYASAGIALPRTAAEQYAAGPLIGAGGPVLPGDLIFSSYGRLGPGVVDHMGMYLGDGRMIVAPRTGTLVQIQPVDVSSARIVGITRPALLDDAGAR